MIQASDTLFVFSDSVVAAVADTRLLAFEYVSSGHAIHAIALTDEFLWMIEEQEGRYALRRTARDLPNGSPQRMFDIPGPGQIKSGQDGSVLYAQSMWPHNLIRFAPDGSRFTFSDLRSLHDSAGNYDNVSVIVTLPPLHLGCGYVLQTLADLRSDKRWLVVREGVTGGVYRYREINDPMGMTQADEQEALLIGFRDAPGRREIVMFRWQWTT